MKTIKLNPLDESSIDRAIAELEKYRDTLPEKEAKLKRKLLGEGREVALARFEESVSNADVPTSMPRVYVSGGERLVASGREVGFIEFGTGVSNPEWNTQGLPVSAPHEPHGTYGYHLGMLKNGWNLPTGEHTRGLRPAEAMLGAWQRITERIGASAREVFGK